MAGNFDTGENINQMNLCKTGFPEFVGKNFKRYNEISDFVDKIDPNKLEDAQRIAQWNLVDLSRSSRGLDRSRITDPELLNLIFKQDLKDPTALCSLVLSNEYGWLLPPDIHIFTPPKKD